LEVHFWGCVWTHLGLRTKPFPHKKEWNGHFLEQSINPPFTDHLEDTRSVWQYQIETVPKSPPHSSPPKKVLDLKHKKRNIALLLWPIFSFPVTICRVNLDLTSTSAIHFGIPSTVQSHLCRQQQNTHKWVDRPWEWSIPFGFLLIDSQILPLHFLLLLDHADDFSRYLCLMSSSSNPQRTGESSFCPLHYWTDHFAGFPSGFSSAAMPLECLWKFLFSISWTLDWPLLQKIMMSSQYFLTSALCITDYFADFITRFLSTTMPLDVSPFPSTEFHLQKNMTSSHFNNLLTSGRLGGCRTGSKCLFSSLLFFLSIAIC